MSQLTFTSHYTRKGLKFGAIFLISFLILKTSYGIARAYWRKLHPLPPPPPNTIFGKLPGISFPQEKGIKPAGFQLQTIDGKLPGNLPVSEKVYFIPQMGGRFLSLDRATSLAGKLGFSGQPEKMTETVYRFENSVNSTVLKIDVLTENFEYAYSYLSDQTLINLPSLPPKEEAVVIANSFLSKIDKLADELKEGEYRPGYWKMETNRINPVASPSEADFVRIDIFRKKIEDQYPILPPDPNKSLVSCLISGHQIQDKKAVEVKFTYFPADREKFGTYPLKTIDQAWDELKAGKYFLASFEGGRNSTIKIRKIYLAYFDPDSAARFLMPIFVFQGDNNFWGYVPALPPEWSSS